jgi:hypothetical protein
MTDLFRWLLNKSNINENVSAVVDKELENKVKE